jgi:hypothetical protein
MSEKRAREEPAVGAPVAAGPTTVNNVTINKNNITNKNTINNYFAPSPRQDAAAQTEPSKKKQKAEPPPPPKPKLNRLSPQELACKPLPEPGEKLQFGDFLEPCVAAVGGACFAYHAKGSRLAGKGEKLRGNIAQAAAARLLELQGFDVVPPPSDEKSVNGTNRGAHSATYDFGIEEGGELLKIEHKSSRMSYEPSKQRWGLQFENVKREASDGIVLCFEGHDALRFYWWDGETYYSKTGKSEDASGGNVKVHASLSQPSFDAAHGQLVAKMDAAFERIGEVRLDDAAYSDVLSTTTKGADAYDEAPLAALSCAARGTALEVLVRQVLEALDEPTADADGGVDCAGKKLGKGSTTSDFKLGDKRGEAKSSLMGWDKDHRRFRLEFTHVKARLHDRLFLAFMTPEAVHVFEYAGDRGRSTHGVATDAKGETITFSANGGKHGSRTWQAAERDLLKKIHFYNSKKRGRYLARVAFAPGDAERVMQLGAEKGDFFDTEE